ncbi:hypothetical protein AgCh_040164 [Apium graveolens]
MAELDALYDAAIAGDAEAIAKLEMEADTLNENDETILHIESEKGNLERVRFILREFANKNLLAKLTICDRSALHHATCGNNTEVAEVVIDAARRHLPVPSFHAFLRQCDEDMLTALHYAVLLGNVAIVKLLVEADPTDNQNIQNNHRFGTPIYIAAEQGHNDIVKVICTTCTAPSLDGPNGSTALHAAIIKNRNNGIEVVEILIDAARRLPSSTSDNDNITDSNPVTSFQASSSSDNDSTDDHPVTSFQAFLRRVDKDLNTALHISVMQGNLATAKLLVESDPSYFGTQNNEGQTPFDIALERGYADIVKMMCTTCTAPYKLYNPDDIRPALHAIINNFDEVRDVIKMTIDIIKCRVILETDEDLDRVHEYLHEIFCEYDQYHNYRHTILELAVERNYVEVVRIILDIQNLAWRIDEDFISLMPLIYKAKDKEYQNMVNVLTEAYEAGNELSKKLRNPADFSKYLQNLVIQNQANLISAIGRRQPETVFDLLRSHGDAESLVMFVDNLGWTALHHAVYHEFDPIIYSIVQAQKTFGHNFWYKTKISTPFHVAAERGYTSAMILLMQLWPSSSSAYISVDKNEQNILHLAALQSKKEMIQEILKYCREECKIEFVNKQDINGNTPLHLLIRRGCLVPELFGYEKLDIMLKNNENWTAPDMLYFEDEIIDQQVQIKIILDGIQSDQEKDVFFSSPVLSSKRDAKDAILYRRGKLMIQEKHAQIKEDNHAIASCFADAIAGDVVSKAALEMEADILNEEGKNILHVESMRGYTERVRYIVREFANKNLLVKLDGSKQTALHLAADHGHDQVVAVLIDAARHLPSSSFSSENSQVTPFQAFIRKATIPMRNTALHLAVLNVNVAIVKLLIQADPNDNHIQNSDGKTPIYIAAEKGYKDIVKEICTTCTALSLDGPGGRTTALHALIQNIGQVTEEAVDVIRMIIDSAKRWSGVDFEALFSRTNELGSTVLQLAVDRNSEDAVKLILEEDPAYQHGHEIKRSCLMRLIYKAIDNGYSNDIVQLLSQTYQVGISPDHKGALELILAIQRLDEDSVLTLLEDSKNLVTFEEENGWTPLHYAAYHEFDSILEAIIQAQEEVGHQFVYGNMVSTPFHVAVKHGYTSTLLQLMELWPISSSASVSSNSPYTAVDKDGRNILHLAAADNNKEMVQGILKYCPEKYKSKILKQQDFNGDTPLHLLISNGCYIPELIKHKGLDTMAKNKNKFTPRDMLYVKDELVADQVHIKIALDGVQTDQSVWKPWAKRTEKRTDIWKSNKVSQTKRKKKDAKFEEGKKLLMDAKHEQMKKDLERYKMRTNTQIIVTALITTVTFTVGFTMPGGLYQSGDVNEGLVVLSRKTAFNAFMVSDALALLLSTSSLFFYFLESMNEDPRQVSKLNAASTVLNIVSVMAMMLTFIAGTYVVLSHSPALAITVSVIGSLFFLLIIVLSIKIVYDRKVKKDED